MQSSHDRLIVGTGRRLAFCCLKFKKSDNGERQAIVDKAAQVQRGNGPMVPLEGLHGGCLWSMQTDECD